MKVAFSTFDRPGNFSGPAVNYQRILPKLAAKGFRVEVIVFDYGRSTHSSILENQGIHCHYLSDKKDIRAKVRRALRILKNVEPDVFVADCMLASLYAGRWAQAAGIPTVACLRSDDAFYAAMLDRFGSPGSPWRINNWVCVSNVLTSRAKQVLGEGAIIRTIASGVPIPTARAKHGSPLRVAYIGRIEELQKQCSIVLDVLIDAIRGGFCAEAVFFGEGSSRVDLEAQVHRMGLHDKIKFAGGVEPSELKKQLESFQAVILVSAYEGLPGALLDGMSVGLVPVITNIPGGVSELVVDGLTGIVCREPADIPAAFDRLAKDKDFWEMLSQSSRDLIKRSYSLSGAVSAWGELLNDVAMDEVRQRKIACPFLLKLPKREVDFGHQDVRHTVGYQLGRVKRVLRRLCVKA